MYTDDTLLTKGQYKYNKLCRVPAEYLLNIYDNNTKNDIDLYDYVKANYHKIKERLITPTLAPKLIIPCIKKPYPTEKEAKKALVLINKDLKEIKLTKAYECDKCSFWHLTSQPQINTLK